MIKHYLKVAFRNLRKYRLQSLISIAGLAAGFVCFALSVLWIRYEMTYDNFLRDAERIYCINRPVTLLEYKTSRSFYRAAANYLKTTFLEIEDAIALAPNWPGNKIKIEGEEYPADIIKVDSSFFRMFDVQIIEGNRNFLTIGSEEIAITQEKAHQWFGDESPVGKMVDYYGEHKICAVVTGLPKRSNYRFDILEAFPSYTWQDDGWAVTFGENVLIKLAAGVDVEAFEKKLYEHEIKRNNQQIKNMMLTPITQLRYSDTDIKRDVRFQHILIFTLAGFLLILCTLFNYLMLFVSRFRVRQKEMALRTVCGASGRSLLALLSVEFCISLLLAFLLGMFFIQLLHESFQRLADIQMDLPAVYGESSLYAGSVILVSLLFFCLLLSLFRRQTLHAAIRRRRKAFFRKGSIVVQLLISIGFAFCSIVILKQMYYLSHTDLGFTLKNRASLEVWNVDYDVLAGQLKQIPEITDAFPSVTSLMPKFIYMTNKAESWDGKSEGEEPEGEDSWNIEFIFVTEQYISYYEFRFLEGETLTDSDTHNQVLINESAAKAFGWDKAVGKKFKTMGNYYTVKGLIKDVYYATPTVPPKPFFCAQKEKADVPYNMAMNTLMFSYEPGTWKTCKAKIEQLVQKEYPNSSVSLSLAEDEYDKYLTSENTLLKILSFVSAVCIMICVFGFVSLVSQTCEERRKEMAIRKISGATVNNLLSNFSKEYLLLLLIGSAIAFAAGYSVMKRWMEQYTLQTSISAWIYAAIFGAMTLIIVLGVGWRVYRASIENPADVVKSE
ncbi:MAG: ABC transporter permease [Dysgonamonadaceae bacterium]|jgi:hypothetical protein|nr:ABC transporter permease [Dysgonamonadaceae bacterium]